MYKGLELVVGSNNPSLPMPQYSKKNLGSHIGKNGEELLTPNWKSKVNDTNNCLIGVVKDRIMCLPVHTFYFLDSEYLYCSYCVIITGSCIDLYHRE